MSRTLPAARILDTEILSQIAPSVVASEPWERMSDRYGFVPTATLLSPIAEAGLVPIGAIQSRSRIPGKADFTKHMLTFRMRSDIRPLSVGEVITQYYLTNSHDGTSCFEFLIGLFRVACANGLMVKTQTIDSIKLRHKGPETILQDAWQATRASIQGGQLALEQADRWKGITLDRTQQTTLVEAYRTIRTDSEGQSTLPPVTELMRPLRQEDRPDSQGRSDLFTVANLVQEKLIRGGIRHTTTNEQGYRRRTTSRATTSVDGIRKTNQAVWSITERAEQILSGLAS